MEQNLKVLLAEDDVSSSILLITILKKNGISYIHAKNGFEAVNTLKENPDISIILMDIKMPVMNGIEATLQIRQFNLTIPIIAQTAYIFTDEQEKIKQAGCTDVISKPVKQQELIELIHKYTKTNV